MNAMSQTQTYAGPWLAWVFIAMMGLAAPIAAMLVHSSELTLAPRSLVTGSILAVGLMGTAMISAAATGRFWVGVLLALLGGTGLVALALVLGTASLGQPIAVGIAIAVASSSFAARGALFARSASAKGWWIAVCVVAGEAAVIVTAAIDPSLWPDWVLVLLPAQWATMAIQSALAGAPVAISALIALAGTAFATGLVVHLWPSRWPYMIMFTAWLGCAALVYHRPGPMILDKLHNTSLVAEEGHKQMAYPFDLHCFFALSPRKYPQ